MTTKFSALDRIILILEYLSLSGPSNSKQIIEATNLPKSTAYLLLEEMHEKKLITRDQNNNYRLWIKLIQFAEASLSQIDIREVARSSLKRLMESTNLLCHLGIIEETRAYYILKIESPATIRVHSFEGKALSLSRSGLGKCLLAWQNEETRNNLVNIIEYKKQTNTSITNKKEMLNEIEKIRKNGWSFDNGEDVNEVRCIAAPVFNSKGELIAAISAVGTSLQITPSNTKNLVNKVMDCAKEISEQMK